MEQLFFVEPGRVEWRDAPLPRITDEEDALVRLVAVATCDLDTGLVHGRLPFPGPFPLGHEGVGEVIEVGSAVTTVKVGQRVIVPFQISCGRCARCSRGLTASCELVDHGAMYGLEPFGGPWGGFLGDLVRVPWSDHMLVPLPPGVDPATVASMSDNIPDGWRAVAPFLGDPSSDSVLVVGGATPSIHCYTIAIARALGVAHVDYLGRHGGNSALSEKARSAGANVIESPGDVRPRSYSLTVCASSDVEALKLALRATEPDGSCVVNAVFFSDEVPLPMFAMYTYGVRLVTGRVNARTVIPRALDLVVEDRFRPASVTDAVVAWKDAADALMDKPQKLVIQR